MNQSLEHGGQWVCRACAWPLHQAAGLPEPRPMWAHIDPCELCGVVTGVSLALNWGLPVRGLKEDWNHCT